MGHSNNQNNKDMPISFKTFLPSIIEMIRTQGVPFLILMCVVVYFHDQNQKLQNKIDNCFQSRLDEADKKEERLIKALEAINVKLKE